MGVDMPRAIAGQALASCIPSGVAGHVKVAWDVSPVPDQAGGSWLSGTVTAPLGIRLRCSVRVSGGPPHVRLLPVR